MSKRDRDPSVVRMGHCGAFHRALATGALAVIVAVIVAACSGASAPEPASDPSGASLPPEPAQSEASEASPDEVPEGAAAPEPPMIALDTHSDTTQRMADGDDLARRLEGGHVDLPRMREGGLDGVFLSIWVDPRIYRGERAFRRAQALIDAVHALADSHPDIAVLCRTAAEVRAAAASGRAAILMGVEGAHALGTSDVDRALQRLRTFHRRGVRYMTITWSTDNPFGHSSTGTHRGEGLTDAGRELVREMNTLGIIPDVSHVSDATLRDVLAVSTRPVFASHSAARALADHPRNITDDGIRAIAETGGAVCINFYAQVIDARYRRRRRGVQRQYAEAFAALAEEHGDVAIRGRAAQALARQLDPELEPPGVARLAEHFAHVVSVGGEGAACVGSDFDGVGELPVGMEDVSDLPALRDELVRRELPVRAILGENVLRILDAQVAEPARPSDQP